MRITRAAKVAAFPLIVLALVALIACQGPAGVKGDKGDTGDTGTTGTTGMDGDPGMDGEPGMDAPIPLTGRAGGVVIDSLNAGRDEDEATEFTIDLHVGYLDGGAYFNGGEAPFKYTVGPIDDSADNEDTITVGATAEIVTAEIDKDTNMFKLKLNAATTWDAADYLTGFTIALTAEDDNNETATSSLTIKPNQAPQNATGVEDSANDGVITSDESIIVIGTMAGVIDIRPGDQEVGNQPRPDGVAMCTTFNSCDLVLFQDQDDFTLSVVADPAGHISWSDEGKGKLKVTGSTATEDDEPVVVDVTATDSDGLSSTLRFSVTVDAAPTISDEGAAVQRSITLMPGDMYSVLGATQTNIVGAFKDDQTVAVAFTTANNLIATVDGSSGQVTAQAKGTTTVTATGTTGEVNTDTNGLGQSVKIEFTITVN